jgi:BioD-like phosphotransacetylase family protein
MKPLFFISNEPFSGKSSVCIGVGKLLTERGLKVGYMKPLGTLPTRIDGVITDEDAKCVSDIFGIGNKLEDISPIVLTQQHYREGLRNSDFSKNFLDIVDKSYKKIKAGKDVVILEGAKSVEDGCFLKMSSRDVCRRLEAKTILITKYSPEIVDHILYAKEFLKDCFAGVIINLVPESQLEYVEELILPFLKREKIEVAGCIASYSLLSSVSVKELAELLGGRIICAEGKAEELVETFMVGAMGQEQALETPTKCLILTGNFQPSSVVLGRAEELGTPIIMVNYDTLTAVEKVGEIMGHVRLHEIKKIDKITEVLRECIDIDKLLEIANI